MKTAISIPDPIFEAAEALAKNLGMTRSELYATAVAQFLESFQDEAVTQALNELYAETPAAVDPVLYQLQLHTLPEEEW
jgi:hypothetical protein